MTRFSQLKYQKFSACSAPFPYMRHCIIFVLPGLLSCPRKACNFIVFRASQGHGPQIFPQACPQTPCANTLSPKPGTCLCHWSLTTCYLKQLSIFLCLPKYGYTKDAVKQKGTEVQFSGCTVSKEVGRYTTGFSSFLLHQHWHPIT